MSKRRKFSPEFKQGAIEQLRLPSLSDNRWHLLCGGYAQSIENLGELAQLVRAISGKITPVTPEHISVVY